MRYSFVIVLLLFMVLFSNCAKKEVQLPIINIEGLTGTYNNSSIWIFFKIKDQDTLAVLNKNNKIINTNWIFNIDKRLPIYKVIPILEDLQVAKYKPSMHKEEGTFMYFSYVNTKLKNISLIEFKPTKYISNKENFQNILNSDSNYSILEIGEEYLKLNNTEVKDELLESKLQELRKLDSLNKRKIVLKYSKNIRYQKYLFTKALLLKSKLKVDSNELIYNLK